MSHFVSIMLTKLVMDHNKKSSNTKQYLDLVNQLRAIERAELESIRDKKQRKKK